MTHVTWNCDVGHDHRLVYVCSIFGWNSWSVRRKKSVSKMHTHTTFHSRAVHGFLDMCQSLFSHLTQELMNRRMCNNYGVMGTLNLDMNFGNGRTMNASMSVEPWNLPNVPTSNLPTTLSYISLVDGFISDAHDDFRTLVSHMEAAGEIDGFQVVLVINVAFGIRTFSSTFSIPTNQARLPNSNNDQLPLHLRNGQPDGSGVTSDDVSDSIDQPDDDDNDELQMNVRH